MASQPQTEKPLVCSTLVEDAISRRAQQCIAADETIIDIFTISEEAAKAEAMDKLHIRLLLCPLFWLHGLCCGPFMYSFYFQHVKERMNTIFILTDRRLYRSVDVEAAGPPSCLGVGTGSRDSGDVLLSDIKGIAVSHPEACSSSKAVVEVRMPPGHPLCPVAMGESGGRRAHQFPLSIPCDDAEAVVQKIRAAQNAQRTAQRNAQAYTPTVIAEPIAVQPMEIAREEVDPMTTIKKLKELLDMGAITQAEFDQKKQEALSKI